MDLTIFVSSTSKSLLFCSLECKVIWKKFAKQIKNLSKQNLTKADSCLDKGNLENRLYWSIFFCENILVGSFCSSLQKSNIVSPIWVSLKVAKTQRISDF